MAVAVGTAVGSDFVSIVVAAANQIPKKIQDVLFERGIHARLVRTLVAELPELSGQRPRGWELDATFENVSAVYHDGSIIVAEYYIRYLTGQIVANPNPAGNFRHELGHGVDDVYSISGSSTGFLEAYGVDLEEMSKKEQQAPMYYRQPGPAGREETVAELFACLYGGGNIETIDLTMFFPRATRVLRQILK
jgi:hypothetical protein